MEAMPTTVSFQPTGKPRGASSVEETSILHGSLLGLKDVLIFLVDWNPYKLEYVGCAFS
jgi:hypothetical protein